MAKLAVTYRSGTGDTEAMVNLVVDGAWEAGVDVLVYTSVEFTPELVNEFEHITFGYPFMEAEQLEESEFEPMLDSVKEKLSSEKVTPFDFYGWGDGEWMRTRDSDLWGAGVSVTGTVIANEAPDDEAVENCKDLGRAFVNA